MVPVTLQESFIFSEKGTHGGILQRLRDTRELGIAVVAIDVNGIMPAVNQAADAGIPVVAIDAILPEGPQKAQIGVDNAEAGAMMGDRKSVV